MFTHRGFDRRGLGELPYGWVPPHAAPPGFVWGTVGAGIDAELRLMPDPQYGAPAQLVVPAARAPVASVAAPVSPAASIAPNITSPAPAPVYYRNNPDGSTSVTPSPDLSSMIEIDPATALTATYVPSPSAQAAPAEKSKFSPLLIGAALIALLGA